MSLADLDHLLTYMCEEVASAEGDCLLAVERLDGLTSRDVMGSDLPPDFFVYGERGALATHVSWSPDPISPLEDCWAIVVVDRTSPALATVGPYKGRWYRIQNLDLPWFLASTAGAIRSSLQTGKPLVPKRADDRRLYGRVADGDVPPVDSSGLI